MELDRWRREKLLFVLGFLKEDWWWLYISVWFLGDIDGLIWSAIGCQTWRKDTNGWERERTRYLLGNKIWLAWPGNLFFLNRWSSRGGKAARGGTFLLLDFYFLHFPSSGDFWNFLFGKISNRTGRAWILINWHVLLFYFYLISLWSMMAISKQGKYGTNPVVVIYQ